MRVVIIDESDDERDRKEVELYKRILQMRGHHVEACECLSDLGESGNLDMYDVAVCHRAYSDIDILDKEIKARLGFRIIWTYLGGHNLELKERESDQVIYFSHPNPIKLAKLIEKGW